MMHSGNFRALAGWLLAGCLAVMGCNRDKVQFDGEIVSSLDNGFADSEFSSIRMIVDAEARADSAVYGKTAGTNAVFCPGASVNISVSGNTAVMTIDFSSGTNCLDGRLRSGRLRAEFDGKWKQEGSSVVITPDNYTVGSYAFDFTHTIIVNPRDNEGRLSWTVDVDDAVLLSAQNGRIDWESDRVVTWLEGEGDLDPTNNVYEITGTAAGIARSGTPFSAGTDEPLVVRGDCQYVVSGVASLTPQGFATRTVDYGQGACDNRAVLTVGNYQQEIFLR